MAGIGAATLPFLGFGLAFLDLENDRDLDLFVANGHVHDVAHLYHDGSTYKQRNQLFLNDGSGRFDEVDASWGPAVTRVEASRAAIVGDLDDDGDPDLVVTNVAAPPQILRNVGGNARAWMRIQLVGTTSNRDGYGADVRVTVAGEERRHQARAASSYLASKDPRLLIGLGGAERVDRVEVRWPSGVVDVLQGAPARRTVVFTEGDGGRVLAEGVAGVGWAGDGDGR